MKVYTHFSNIQGTTEGVRWRTLLQFGTSFNIIGTVVMKNPGSSDYKEPSPLNDESILYDLSRFDEGSEPWYEFKADTTMHCVAELFANYYGYASTSELDGVIQIFNLFYLKEADLGKAIDTANRLESQIGNGSSYDLIEYDIAHLVAPIYLGFSDLAWSKSYGHKARQFFDAAKDIHGMNYLCPNYRDNSFTHPLYLMRHGKYKANSIRTRMLFRQQSFVMDSDKFYYNTPEVLDYLSQVCCQKSYVSIDYQDIKRLFLGHGIRLRRIVISQQSSRLQIGLKDIESMINQNGEETKALLVIIQPHDSKIQIEEMTYFANWVESHSSNDGELLYYLMDGKSNDMELILLQQNDQDSYPHSVTESSFREYIEKYVKENFEEL